MNIEQSVTIQRSVEDVWKFLSNIANVPKWDRGVLAAQQTSEGPLGVGATIQTVRQLYAWRRIGTYRISAYEPNRKIALEAAVGPFRGQVAYAMQPVGGGTIVTAAATGEIVGPYRVIAPLLVRMLTRDGEADLANVKRCVEALAPERRSGEGF